MHSLSLSLFFTYLAFLRYFAVSILANSDDRNCEDSTPLSGTCVAEPLLSRRDQLLSSCCNSANFRDCHHRRIEQAKLDLWLRGAFALDEKLLSFTAATLESQVSNSNSKEHDGLSLAQIASEVEQCSAKAPLRHGPVREVRRRLQQQSYSLGTLEDPSPGNNRVRFLTDAFNTRGGDGGGIKNGYKHRLEMQLKDLTARFGREFADAIEQNTVDHTADCTRSCELFYCANSSKVVEWDTLDRDKTSFLSYSFGPVPPEDFSEEFRFPLDLIKVTQGFPLFSAEESAEVIRQAEEEGVDKNEYESGKYKLGGDWLVNLPKTREWFNKKLESTLFPLLHYLFPEIIQSPTVLRAHSVSLLKYNSTHPRTDVHIDNGILAMTLAMTPKSDYVGGGTFYEHMGVDNVLPMDVGHGTFRPGSVRHGGHRVSSGTRYILGAFLLLEDHVEHVRRLKNRGAELRTNGDLVGAIKHFEWALALNPRCTTCLKDWAEVLLSQKMFLGAEEKIRSALELLEGQDSDALFTLGLILSEQGKHDESISVYKKSIELNSEDAELCYNLGIKLGEQGDTKGEIDMYIRATKINPNMGGAWINMGTSLAESGNLEDAEIMFLKAIECCAEVKTKGLMNLALLLQKKANGLASSGDLPGAKSAIFKASKLLDEAKPLLDASIALGGGDSDDVIFAAQFRPLRVQCHRLVGQILAGIGDFPACEAEFRTASEKFGEIPGVWEALARILEIQGKSEEARKVREKLAELKRSL